MDEGQRFRADGNKNTPMLNGEGRHSGKRSRPIAKGREEVGGAGQSTEVEEERETEGIDTKKQKES